MPDQRVKSYLAAVLDHGIAYNQAIAKKIAEYEASGYRIVGGGQTSQNTWDITDYRTSQLIAEGDDGLAGYLAVEPPEGEDWIHIDPLTEEATDSLDEPDNGGLPESFCEVIRQWFDSPGTDPDDIAEITGFPTERIIAAREYDE